jgi:hypothetical protein
MRTALKFWLFDFFQDTVFAFLVWREKIKRSFNKRPKSFWDL